MSAILQSRGATKATRELRNAREGGDPLSPIGTPFTREDVTNFESERPTDCRLCTLPWFSLFFILFCFMSTVKLDILRAWHSKKALLLKRFDKELRFLQQFCAL